MDVVVAIVVAYFAICFSVVFVWQANVVIGIVVFPSLLTIFIFVKFCGFLVVLTANANSFFSSHFFQGSSCYPILVCVRIFVVVGIPYTLLEGRIKYPTFLDSVESDYDYQESNILQKTAFDIPENEHMILRSVGKLSAICVRSF